MVDMAESKMGAVVSRVGVKGIETPAQVKRKAKAAHEHDVGRVEKGQLRLITQWATLGRVLLYHLPICVCYVSGVVRARACTLRCTLRLGIGRPSAQWPSLQAVSVIPIIAHTERLIRISINFLVVPRVCRANSPV